MAMPCPSHGKETADVEFIRRSEYAILIALMLERGVISTKDEVLQIIDRLNGSVASPASAPAAQAAPWSRLLPPPPRRADRYRRGAARAQETRP